MRHAFPIVLCGAAAAAALFAALRIGEPAAARRPDPWLTSFRARSLNARLLSESEDLSQHFPILEWREGFRERGLLRAPIREYLVEDVRVQIVSFPPGRSPENWIETGKVRDSDTKRVYFVELVGRFLLLFHDVQRTPFGFPRSVPESLRNRILDAFRFAAGE